MPRAVPLARLLEALVTALPRHVVGLIKALRPIGTPSGTGGPAGGGQAGGGQGPSSLWHPPIMLEMEEQSELVSTQAATMLATRTLGMLHQHANELGFGLTAQPPVPIPQRKRLGLRLVGAKFTQNGPK